MCELKCGMRRPRPQHDVACAITEQASPTTPSPPAPQPSAAAAASHPNRLWPAAPQEMAAEASGAKPAAAPAAAAGPGRPGSALPPMVRSSPAPAPAPPLKPPVLETLLHVARGLQPCSSNAAALLATAAVPRHVCCKAASGCPPPRPRPRPPSRPAPSACPSPDGSPLLSRPPALPPCTPPPVPPPPWFSHSRPHPNPPCPPRFTGTAGRRQPPQPRGGGRLLAGALWPGHGWGTPREQQAQSCRRRRRGLQACGRGGDAGRRQEGGCRCASLRVLRVLRLARLEQTRVNEGHADGRHIVHVKVEGALVLLQAPGRHHAFGVV